jgi:CelD/BcsL family acetyltransferase involved in cellulose biosynthesis
MLEIKSIHTVSDFIPLRLAWEALYAADPEAHVFLSWQWLLGVFESRPGEWFILLATAEAGELVGALALRTKSVWSQPHEQVRTELQFAGRLFWADYGGMLCHPSHESVVFQGFAKTLRAMNWSHLTLKGFRVSDRRLSLFSTGMDDERLQTKHRTSLINNGETDNLCCPFIDLPETFENWLVGYLSANTRQKVRRYLRKVEESPDYRFTVSTSRSIVRDTLLLQSLWSSQWKAEKGNETPRIAYQYGRIIRRGFADGLVHLCILWHADVAIGVFACFVDGQSKRLHFYIGGRDQTFEAIPVGLVLHALNIRWAIEHGFREYDFLRGSEPYKYSLGATDRRLKYPCFTTRSGVNLNGELDETAIPQALVLAESFTAGKQDERARRILGQVVSASQTSSSASTPQ